MQIIPHSTQLNELFRMTYNSTHLLSFQYSEIIPYLNYLIFSSKYRNAFKRLAFDLPILGKLIKGESASANNIIHVKPSIHLKPTFLRNEVYPKN